MNLVDIKIENEINKVLDKIINSKDEFNKIIKEELDTISKINNN